MRVYTSTLTTGSITIQAGDNVNQLSVQANDSSSCQIQGDMSFRGNPSTPVTLANGETYNLATTPNSPIQGLTITWLSGTIDITMSF